MSIQDVRLNAMKCVSDAKVPSVSKYEDNSFRVDNGNVMYASEQEALEAAKAKQLLNILVSIAEGLELDWGYNGKLIEITLPRDKRRGNCKLCQHEKKVFFIPREEPCGSCFNSENRPNWSAR